MVGVVVTYILAGYVLGLIGLWIAVYRQDKDLVLAKPNLPTILFAYKDEEATLPGLVFSLSKTSYSVPILAIDDGSKDRSTQILHQAASHHPGLTLVANMGPPGKRQAIHAGIQETATETIVQTDADCRPQPNWALRAAQALKQSGADMLIMPLRFRSDHISWLWLSIVNMEFASVMALTCGMARAGKPVMCNGANLAYKKALWQAAAPGLLAQPYAGGDDMFLLDYAVTQNSTVAYSDAPGLWLDTDAPSTLGAFLRQRRRWAAKWRGYRSPWPLLVGMASLAGQLAFAWALISLLAGQGSRTLVYLALGKIGAEGLLLYRQLHKGSMRFSPVAFLFWQVFYLPYVMAVALPSFIRRPASWKN